MCNNFLSHWLNHRKWAQVIMLSCLSVKRNLNMSCKITTTKTGIILCIRPANMRWRYIVTSSLIGWAHTQNDPCKGPMMGIYGMSFISTKSDLLTVTTKCSGSFRNRICPFVCLSFHMSIPKQVYVMTLEIVLVISSILTGVGSMGTIPLEICISFKWDLFQGGGGGAVNLFVACVLSSS